MTALMLLGTRPPILYQGQMLNATELSPFFADDGPQTAPLVRKGRGEFMAQFPSCSGAEVQETMLDPGARATFERARLDWNEPSLPPHTCVLALYRDLLTLRREDPVLSRQGLAGCQLDGAVLSDQ